MIVTRMDLDGRGAGSPEGLVTLILKAEKDLPIPVPIEDLCRQLDIQEIKPLDTEAFEGALITDTSRNSGVVLVNQNRPRQRQRFTIAHELGHFLIPTHIPHEEGKFLCSREDMQRLSAKENDRRARMEVEANRFASLLLIPPPHLRLQLRQCRTPDLQHIPQLARAFDVSKQAMARAYAEYHEEPIAIVVIHEGQVQLSYSNRTRFPYVHVTRGQAVPGSSYFHRGRFDLGVASGTEECDPELWVSPKSGLRFEGMTEQVYLQQSGYALILLHLSIADEDEEAEEDNLRKSWHVGFRR